MTKRAHPFWISPFWISSIGLLLVATPPALCPALLRAQGKSDAPQSVAMSTPTPGADATQSPHAWPG